MTFDAKFWRPFPHGNNLSWNWPDRRLQQKEAYSCYLFIEIKCTLLVRFPTDVTGCSLAEVVEIANTFKDLKSK